jgi:hypothetical protein
MTATAAYLEALGGIAKRQSQSKPWIWHTVEWFVDPETGLIVFRCSCEYGRRHPRSAHQCTRDIARLLEDQGLAVQGVNGFWYSTARLGQGTRVADSGEDFKRWVGK